MAGKMKRQPKPKMSNIVKLNQRQIVAAIAEKVKREFPELDFNHTLLTVSKKTYVASAKVFFLEEPKGTP